MHYEEKEIQVAGSQPGTKLHIYIQDSSDALCWKERPLVLVCPGGGYQHTSDREAEPVAMQFLSMGYHVAVLRYSVAPAVYPTALLELCASMIYIREHAKEWSVKSDAIYVGGFSAGGHLAASLGVFWKTDKQLADYFQVEAEVLQPNALILCYPVITSGEYAHRGSFDNLLAGKQELLDKMSLENQVNEYVPKTFIWHTFEDKSVPLENSLYFAKALREHNIPFEYHVFPNGHHGLGLANRLSESEPGIDTQKACQAWISLCKTFLEENCE